MRVRNVKRESSLFSESKALYETRNSDSQERWPGKGSDDFPDASPITSPFPWGMGNLVIEVSTLSTIFL